MFQIVNTRFIHHSEANDSNNRELYSVETFKTGENGWGYNIVLRDKKVIIKQDIIPAVQRSIPFQSEEDARKTALLVINKLNHKNGPTVTVSELDSLHIVF